MVAEELEDAMAERSVVGGCWRETRGGHRSGAERND